MNKNKILLRVLVKATGKFIDVYRTHRGTYCDYADCKTEYNADELKFSSTTETPIK